ncbi:MAG: 1-deoxy-D-xylulose-5-phosphate reductoisomerase [Balneolaceae bacterium]
MKHRKLSILGSTGSIGTQTLEIAESQPDYFDVTALSAHSNWKLLADQANRFRPDYLLLCNEEYRSCFEEKLEYKPQHVLYNPADLIKLAVIDEVDVVLNSLVGFAGFEPTCEALKAGKRVALANKESLVVGGEIINRLIRSHPGGLIPIDSEHSAMLQCLAGESKKALHKIVITASGGPFLDWSEDRMSAIRVEDALDHPNWSMGAKVTIDSSTLMNKGLEIIEAKWLFDLPLDRIEPVIHPESIIHSVIEFIDGSSKAQLGPPDMKVPIMYALSYPDRVFLDTPRIDWKTKQAFTFEPVDYGRFPCLKLAIDAGTEGGYAPAVLNASNEVAVDRFLKREIDYIDIARIVEGCLEKITGNTDLTPAALHEVDRETRILANII